ncbi:MAG: PEP-CTERM sorting domain-containing protein [Acidobacteria bacterium]|nr:PEP-CTERM sorting domain-containing protein [Acidobacteriota bacterium]
MKKILMLSWLLAAAATLPAAPAAYNLSFTGGPVVPTAGSFTYDASLAVNPFSSFFVTEVGSLFDFTSAANAFTGNGPVGVCKSSQSAAGLFNALTTAGCQTVWTYQDGGISQLFQILTCSDTSTCGADGAVYALVNVGGGGSPISFGVIAATPASTVPEPGVLWLSGIGIVALMARGWARRKRSGAVSGS